METIENALVVGAILWLVQTVLDNLAVSGKLDEWIRQVGLAEHMEKLRTEIERVETVVAAVNGRATGNKPLARSLGRLRELMYDADDVVDELDYFRLQQQVEGDATASVCANNESEDADLDEAEVVVDGTSDNPNIPSSSKKRKNRCEAWDHFVEIRKDGKRYAAECIRCRALIQCNNVLGTNGLKKHLGVNGQCLRKPPPGDHPPAPTSANDGTPNGITDATLHSVVNFGERMRTDDTSTPNIISSTYCWNKGNSSKRMHQIALELQGLRGTLTEFLKDSVASSDQYRSNTLDMRLRTTSLVPRNVYGRDEKKDYFIRIIMAAESDDIAVLPIVGIAGVGKTLLAQLVYNDPKVESQFERIWVCVSYDFDEVTLTREMLDFFQEGNEGPPKIQYKHQGTSGLGGLQEILKAQMQCRTKRFLLILDDVWDNLDGERWKRLLLPFQSGHAKGNVILVTTRDLSVARRIGTEEPIKLDVLGKNDFWLLYKSFAFGDNYEEFPSLNNIGQQIAEKLKGNPLAAETAGKILREHLNLEHWSRILKNEDWKSLQLTGGIMSALKLSYDQLPYHLKQCFLYCSIFPNSYQFVAKDLVRTWISLGFVRCASSSKKLEETGPECLNNLVNRGFLERVDKTKASGEKACYAICGIMHDFGRLVSKTEYATIDGLKFNEILPTIRHLAIVTDSAYIRDQHGTIVRNEKFETNLQSIFEPAGKLRTLVLLGNYDKYFFMSFQAMLPKVQNLRLLQISSTSCELYSFEGSLVSPVHLRRLKLESRNTFNGFPQAISKWYHIQGLDLVDSSSQQVYSEIIGKLTSLQEVNCAGCDITKLESMSELVELRVYMLRNVITRHVAYGSRLRDKPDLETLLLSWKDNLSQDESDSDEESSPVNESFADTVSDVLKKFLPVNGHFADTESDVLEGLEPHRKLKYLHILGYNGAKSPTWLGSSVSFLQKLHLEDCGKWEELRFLGSLPFLTKLKLKDLQKVEDVSIPSLEELVLIKMPKLERCSCDSVRNLNSSLRVLKIVECSKLKVFPLFGSCGIEQKSWLFHLRELTISGCPDLAVSHPLPPSSSICKLSIKGVPKLPDIKGTCDGELTIEDCHSNVLTERGTKLLAFHNLRVLHSLTIYGFNYPIFSSLEDFRQLINLMSLEICHCKSIFSSNFSQGDTDMAPENINALPSLKRLRISYSSTEGLSVLLRNVQTLEELNLRTCDPLTGLVTENEESELSNPKSVPEASSGDAVTGLSRDGLLRIPSKLISSLKKLSLYYCSDLTHQGEVFSKLTSLEELCICRCTKLILSCVHKDTNDEHANGWLLPQSLAKLEIDWSLDSETTLRLCFPGHLSGLKRLKIRECPRLESLQLQYCTALEELFIRECKSLIALEALPSLGGLRRLEAFDWPHLTPCLERVLSEGSGMRPRLEILRTNDYTVLTTSICRHLTALVHLEICTSIYFEVNLTRLTEEQESALHLLKSLQLLSFTEVDFPVGLHNLPSLKVISRLPEKGLPPSLQKLDIWPCNEELADQCRKLATSKLKICINGEYVN